ncbi:DUF3140 domain-containing protein [Rubrivirga marina]|uniref:DNA-binding protein n=1 Tax=Rubrivirga marina TaxID=1196024 RepID=A0A271J449_9BACT|nr:DUF3140 domain-containing protein [Rubrivirga marina]PAP77814.1 DNA-binding protein [Rubrivirga marina]
MDWTDDRQETYDAFRAHVNMEPKELEEWLETEDSKRVGDSGSGESTGHRSGRRIVEIKRTTKDDLTESDLDHMQKVVGYIKRHTAQGPESDVKESNWRYSLMNWGHDPCKEQDC